MKSTRRGRNASILNIALDVLNRLLLTTKCGKKLFDMNKNIEAWILSYPVAQKRWNIKLVFEPQKN